MTVQDGEVVAVDRDAAPEGQVDRYIGPTADDVLAQVPPSDLDVAWTTVCDALKSCGLQQPWPLLGQDGNLTPYREPSAAVIRAAALLGVDWQARADPYAVPPLLRCAIARAPWDLGCLDLDAIPDPYEGLPWDQDDDDDGPPRLRRLAPRVDIDFDELREVYLGNQDLSRFVQNHLRNEVARELQAQGRAVLPPAPAQQRAAPNLPNRAPQAAPAPPPGPIAGPAARPVLPVVPEHPEGRDDDEDRGDDPQPQPAGGAVVAAAPAAPAPSSAQPAPAELAPPAPVPVAAPGPSAPGPSRPSGPLELQNPVFQATVNRLQRWPDDEGPPVTGATVSTRNKYGG